jgi:hypothetical protein
MPRGGPQPNAGRKPVSNGQTNCWALQQSTIEIVKAEAKRRSVGVQKRRRLVRCQRIGYISKVQAAHQFRWAHVDQQLPNCFTLELSPQVPHAIVPDGTSVGNFQLSRKYRAGRKRQASDCENGLELPKFRLTKFVKTSLTGSLLAGDRRD